MLKSDMAETPDVWLLGQAGELVGVSGHGYHSGTIYVMSYWRVFTTGQQGGGLSVYLLFSGWDLMLFWKETALPLGQLDTLDVDNILELRVKWTESERAWVSSKEGFCCPMSRWETPGRSRWPSCLQKKQTQSQTSRVTNTTRLPKDL